MDAFKKIWNIVTTVFVAVAVLLAVALAVDSTTGTGTVLVTDLPLGSLTVTEDTAWSWRYNAASTNSATVDLVTPGAEHTVDFTNTLEKEKWLDVAIAPALSYGFVNLLYFVSRKW